MRLAAEELFITQPAITKQMSQLGECLGKKLFYYDGKKLHLTSAGEHILPFFVDIENSFRQLTDQGAQKPQRTFSAVITPSLEPLLFSIYKEIAEKLNLEDVLIYSSLPEDLITKFYYYNADFIFSSSKVIHNAITSKKIASSPILMVCSQASRLSKIKFDYSAAKATPFIRWEGQVSSLMENLIFKQQLKVAPKVITVSTGESARKAVLANLGYSFLPKHMINKELKSGALVEINYPFPVKELDIYISYQSSKPLKDTSSEVMKQIQYALEKHS